MYFTKHEHPRARVAHTCTICYRTIDAGETYWRGRGYDGGDAWTWRTCEHCYAVGKIYDPRDYDGLLSEDSYRDWLDDGARDIAELRHMVGLRMRWRNKQGDLLPVPVAKDETRRRNDG